MNRNLKSRLVQASAAVGTGFLTLATYAQAAAPTSATQLAASIDVGDAKGALYTVGGIVLGLVMVGVAIALVIRFARKH